MTAKPDAVVNPKGRHRLNMTEGLIIAMLVCIVLTLIAYRLQSLPIIFVSSIGWLIAGLQTFQQTEEVLPMILMLMLAFGQFFLVKSARV